MVSLILLSVHCTVVEAAPLPRYSGAPIIQSFSERDLPANPHTRAVAIHPSGLVYVGTIEGLLEYDGATWRLIPGTGGLIVHNIAITPHGRVFYSGGDCFGLLEPDQLGRLVARPLQNSLPEAYRAVGHVLRLIVAGETAWLATQGPQPALVRVDTEGRTRAIPLDGPLRLPICARWRAAFHDCARRVAGSGGRDRSDRRRRCVEAGQSGLGLDG